jgi:SAM-dependent methyltransferase
VQKLYTSGDYLIKNPTWHADESPWKAKYVLQIMRRNNISPKTICDVGCGAGEVLRLLQESIDPDCLFWGYDISPQALALSQKKANGRLHFKLADIRQEDAAPFDLILLMDVIEHMEDYFSFLREIRSKSSYKILQIPLDISVQEVFMNKLIRFRGDYGHIHYFTKDLALQMLRDVGYEVIDYLYTWPSYGSLQLIWSENKRNPRRLLKKLIGFVGRKILAVPKHVFFALNKDLTTRVLAGWRLLVLVK